MKDDALQSGQAMEKAYRDLKESEERYRSLFNSIDEGFCVIEMIFDSDGKPADYTFLETNPAFEMQSGLRGVAGRRVREILPQLESHWFETYGRVALTGESTRFIDEVRGFGEKVESGSVVLVGAGPGDPELLTLRAVRALQSADVILYDDRVSPEILEFARREARKMLVGKAGNLSGKPDEINGLIVGLAKAGRRVVRLKGGNPAVDDEIAASRKAGIAVEAIPGIATPQRAITPVRQDGRFVSLG